MAIYKPPHEKIKTVTTNVTAAASKDKQTVRRVERPRTDPVIMGWHIEDYMYLDDDYAEVCIEAWGKHKTGLAIRRGTTSFRRSTAEQHDNYISYDSKACTAIWDEEEYRENSLISSLRSTTETSTKEPSNNMTVQPNVKLKLSSNNTPLSSINPASTLPKTAVNSNASSVIPKDVTSKVKETKHVPTPTASKPACARESTEDNAQTDHSDKAVGKKPELPRPAHPVFQTRMATDQTSRVQRLINITQKREAAQVTVESEEVVDSGREDIVEKRNHRATKTHKSEKTSANDTTQNQARTGHEGQTKHSGNCGKSSESKPMKSVKDAAIEQERLKPSGNSNQTESNVTKVDIIDITQQRTHVITDLDTHKHSHGSSTIDTTDHEATSSGYSSKSPEQLVKSVRRNRKEMKEKQALPLKMISMRSKPRDNQVAMPEIVAVKIHNMKPHHLPVPDPRRESSHISRTSEGTPSAVAVEGSCHSSRTSVSSPYSSSERTTEDTESVTSSELSNDSFTTAVKRCSNFKHLDDKENRLDVCLLPDEKPEARTGRRNIKPFQNTSSQRTQASMKIKKVTSEDLSAVELMSTSESLSSDITTSTGVKSSIDSQVPEMILEDVQREDISSKLFRSNGVDLRSVANITRQKTTMPVGDLLPAVERVSANRSSGFQSSLDRLHSELSYLRADAVLPYEESLMVMKEGLDILMKEKSNMQSLGPPGFRAHQSKAPFVRGKDTNSRRLGILGVSTQSTVESIAVDNWSSKDDSSITALRRLHPGAHHRTSTQQFLTSKNMSSSDMIHNGVNQMNYTDSVLTSNYLHRTALGTMYQLARRRADEREHGPHLQTYVPPPGTHGAGTLTDGGTTALNPPARYNLTGTLNPHRSTQQFTNGAALPNLGSTIR